MGNFSRQVDLSQGGGGLPRGIPSHCHLAQCHGFIRVPMFYLKKPCWFSYWPCCDCGQLNVLENTELGYVGCIRMGRQHLSLVGVTQSPGDRERQAG